MKKQKALLNKEVTQFLDSLNHPFRKEIEQLRTIIISAHADLTENIKWNGPNYCYNDADRITLRIQPPKQLQLIFHRGAKVQQQPKENLIKDDTGILTWKETDRAVATFKSGEEIESRKEPLANIVNDWIKASAISKIANTTLL